jgi:hypothetical protein
MAMTYDAFLDQMKKDLEAGFAEDLPAMGSSTGASPCIAQEHERGHGRNDGNENIKIDID